MGPFFKILPFFLIAVNYVSTQYQSQDRHIQEIVEGCYRNQSAYDRYRRQPMHMENLVAIIRKIEIRMVNQWDMRKIARSVLKRYQLDGMKYDPQIQDPALAYNKLSKESQKQYIIHSLIGGGMDEQIPDGVLDNDDKCALHWMLSTSLNATLREEDMPGYYPPSYQQQRHRRSNNDRDDIPLEGLEEQEEKPNVSEEITEKNNEELSKENNEDEAEVLSGEKVRDSNSGEVDVVEENNEIDGESTSTRKFARQVNAGPSGMGGSGRNAPRSKQPIETGVIYTKWGAVSGGRVLAGIVAGLEPQQVVVGSFTSGGSYGSGSSSNGNWLNSPEFFPPNQGNPPNSGGFYPPGSNNPGYQQPGSNNPGYGQQPGSNGNGNGNGGQYNPNAGFNPNQPPMKSNNGQNQKYGRRKKRQASAFQPLQNLHAATLAGDIGQGAILNSQYSNNFRGSPPPNGQWNDTICPREFILDPLSTYDPNVDFFTNTWSFMTGAEILGGVDGLILGQNIGRWDTLRSGLKLSNILEQYYSEIGVAGESRFRACSRNSLFAGNIDMNIVREQARSFAWLYNNKTHILHFEDLAKFDSLVETAMQAAQSFASNEGGKYICQRREVTNSQVDMNDRDKYTDIKNTIFAVVDYTVGYEELDQQLRFIAQLSNELHVSPRGARMGIINGASGFLTIHPNSSDNAPVMACNILALPKLIGSQYQIPQVLNTLKGEIQKMRDIEERQYENLGVSNGITVLFMIQGKRIEENQADEIRRLINDYKNEFGDIHIMFTSSKFTANDFENILPDSERDFVKIRGSYNLSSDAEEFVKEFQKRGSHGKLQYPKCNMNRYEQDNEHKLYTDLFITPGNIQYYQISPDYFYSARQLLLRFSSDNGKARICSSRHEPFPNSNNVVGDIWCVETTGSYQFAGASNWNDPEFKFDKPCGSDGERRDCRPIYLSITPTVFGGSGSLGLDCSVEACDSPNQVKVSFSHWDMRCNTNGAFYKTLSPLLVLIISTFYFIL